MLVPENFRMLCSEVFLNARLQETPTGPPELPEWPSAFTKESDQTRMGSVEVQGTSLTSS
jgi:hypothetical protein